MSLRNQLIAELEKIPHVAAQESKVAGGYSLFVKNKEIAHFHGANELDLRLTKQIIKQQQLTHPENSQFHPNRKSGSHWIELRFFRKNKIPEIVELFKLATSQYK